jgi:sterol desaturase/sphingolipid hydroxylase (fatty acid hydroxylase superfamily)
MYINGYLDAIPFAVLFAVTSFLLAPYYKAPVFVAALLQSYVIEEWVHYSVHFHTFKSRYFRYIRRHHWYHHSRGEIGEAFGLTSGLWDGILGTRIPPKPWPRAPRRRHAVAGDRDPHRPPDPSGAMGPEVDRPRRALGEAALSKD